MKQCLMVCFMMIMQSCGTSPTVSVRLRAADNNPQGNPFAEVQGNVQSGLSRGLYFQVFELTACPETIQDISNDSRVISQPNESELGSSPASASFSIDISKLDKNKAYAIKVVAVASDNVQITHEGFSDCPIYPSDAGKQNVTLCFAIKGVTPQCSGSTNFADCRKPTNC